MAGQGSDVASSAVAAVRGAPGSHPGVTAMVAVMALQMNCAHRKARKILESRNSSRSGLLEFPTPLTHTSAMATRSHTAASAACCPCPPAAALMWTMAELDDCLRTAAPSRQLLSCKTAALGPRTMDALSRTPVADMMSHATGAACDFAARYQHDYALKEYRGSAVAADL